jgi:hypothetical protein
MLGGTRFFSPTGFQQPAGPHSCCSSGRYEASWTASSTRPGLVLDRALRGELHYGTLFQAGARREG